MDKRRELIEAYAEFLLQFEWQWFVTLTFRGWATPPKADRLFRRWIGELQMADGSASLRWFRVPETGLGGFHFHALIGGLAHPMQRERWERRWGELAGDGQIKQYDADQNAVYYMLMTLQPDRDFDFATNLDRESIIKMWEGDV